MKKINISLPGASYNILIGRSIFKNLLSEISRLGISTNCFIIIDKKVYSLYKKNVEEIFRHINKATLLSIASREKLKTFDTLEKIYNTLLKNHYNRDTLIISIGGGIIGDLSGFAASTYMRGIPYINIPTTLLAAVDSSIGGKTGVNFGETKNSIGTFYQPQMVLIDTDYFHSLNREEITCGLGEIIKYAFLGDKNFYNYVYKNINESLKLKSCSIDKLVIESVKLKSSVVVQDEKDSGLRKILNFGHTFAHALEIEQGHKLKHGQAVIVGINCSLHLSVIKGLLSREKFKEFQKLISKIKIEIKIQKVDKKKIYSIMKRDKKNKAGKIKFVLIKDIGEIVLDVEAERKEIYEALENGTGIFI